jgi:hypothetical protein
MLWVSLKAGRQSLFSGHCGTGCSGPSGTQPERHLSLGPIISLFFGNFGCVEKQYLWNQQQNPLIVKFVRQAIKTDEWKESDCLINSNKSRG